MLLPLADVSVLALVLALILAAHLVLRRLRRLKRYAKAARRYRDRIARVRRRRRLSRLSAVEVYLARTREAAAPVVVTTPEGAIAAASRSALDLFGYSSEEELKQISIKDVYVSPADRTQYVRTALEEEGRIRSRELRLKRHDGREIQVLASVRVVSMEDGACYYETVLTDITELREAVEQRRQLEAQLHLARKLELVGQLASGIAHEINTPLQFIGDNAVFLKSAFERLTANTAGGDRPRLLQDVSEAFRDSFEGIERVSETVRAMKEFAHPGDLEIASTDLNQAIRTTLIVARNEYKHAADVKTVFGDIPPVDCRRAEINKVLLNLIVNAAHAIEGAGKPGRGSITITSRSEGEHVYIDIADTGCGISHAVMPRIFDPFFTTKAVGKGSGQGLAIARNIMKAHGGELTVASTVGEGATFTLKLPAGAEARGGDANSPNVEALIG
ncbi:MAG TPA: ATP-binding protein [Steroidobacteraceae bacterium]|nr:ATP-binding protein [Steroidobacteraceae bacterium]